MQLLSEYFLFSVLVLCVTSVALVSPSAHANKNLDVYINVTHSLAASFHRSSPFYQAGSALTLTCMVDGPVAEGVFFEWSSDCKGAACFGIGSPSQFISTDYLESKDSGTHTCTVHDALGCSGNASIAINVVGIGIYVTRGHRFLPTDGLIVAQPITISEFRCLSGSTQYNVGQFIGTNGENIVSDTSDPFFISRGTRFSPGVIHVRSNRELETQYEGIYTCRMPDETGNVTSINVGLYRHGVGAPTVTGIELRAEGSLHTLVCNSTGSPPTTVLWTFNDKPVSASHGSSRYTSESKIITDRKKSSYSSMLNINGSFKDIVGQYSCQVRNQLGASSKVTKEVKALYISGSEKPIIVGLSRKINCSTPLNVSLMEWILVGIQDDPVEQTTGSQSLTLTVSPQNAGLDGAMFTCRATTYGGKVFEETITVQVKEITNTVSITGGENSLLAGDRHTLECRVESDVPPTVRWKKDESNITNSSNFLIEGPTTSGLTTVLVLRLTFLSLATYHGGVYYCESTVDNPPSIQQESQNITVKIPQPSVSIIRSPSDDLLYTTTQLNITCLAEVVGVDNTNIDDVSVNGTWSGPANRALKNVDISKGFFYESSLTISSLQSADSGTYTCSFSVTSSSLYIEQSEEVSVSTSFQAALKVSVVVTYTSPDQYPVYSPPLFRAVSSVTLRCVAEGASGSVNYQWSSTCSSCFASNSRSSTISEQFLRSRDSGNHTCTARDTAGNTGTYVQQMTITGAGIYVQTASRYGGRSSSQPNNTYITYQSPSRGSDYFYLYCCSGSKSGYVGTITDPNGDERSSDYSIYDIHRYSSSSSYAGCVRFRATRPSWYHSSSSPPISGAYTCNIQDENGIIRHVGFTISSSTSYPRIQTFTHVQNTNIFTLSCVTSSAPPTTLQWRRNGVTLDIDGTTHQLTQTVTNRPSVYYNNKLEIFDHLDKLTGLYQCSVDNNHYYSARSRTLSITGIRVTTSVSRLRVGQSVSIDCTSDLNPNNITWYKEDGTVVQRTSYGSSNRMRLNPVSTNDEGRVYRCEANSQFGSQERSITISTYVPDNWARVQITGHEGDAVLHGNNYTLTCTVTLISGITLPVTMEWVYSNTSVVSSNHLIISRDNTSSLVTTLRLTFAPIVTTDGGDYTCRASINVSWMNRQPSVISESVHIPVTTQALFQLNMGPVQYCVNWQDDQAYQLEEDIQASIETAIQEKCDCDFERSAIYSGEFSCQTTTTNVIYRAIINGTSDLLTAPQLMDLIENWRTTGGTLLYNSKFRLRLARKEACPLQIESFHDLECSGAGSTNASSSDLEYVQMDRYYKITV